MSLLKTKIAKKISLSIILILSFSYVLKAGEVMVWDCNKFENARIVGEDGTYLGKLGPSWMNESIFNSFFKITRSKEESIPLESIILFFASE